MSESKWEAEPEPEPEKEKESPLENMNQNDQTHATKEMLTRKTRKNFCTHSKQVKRINLLKVFTECDSISNHPQLLFHLNIIAREVELFV